MSLLAAYNFDETSGDVVDVTGNGNDFTPSGTTARTTGDGGHTDEGLTQGSTTNDEGPTIFGQTTARTLMFWLKSAGDFTGWIFEWHDNDADTGFWGMLCLSGNMGFRGRNAGGSTAFASISRPADGEWHHWCGTYDGSSVRLYVDGVLQGSPVALATGIASTADVLRVFTSAGSGQVIDDVRIYDEALDQSTIAALMDTPVTEDTLDEITGTAAFTSPAGEMAASGTVEVSGAGDFTAAAADLAAAAAVTVAGTAAFTAAAGQLDAAVDVTVSGTAALTSAPGELAAAGTVAITGTAAFTAPAAVLAGTDEVPHDVDLTASLGAQDSPTASLGTRRWTATLGSQP